jgi:nicotinic acid mononucleotide adenylyltransferase
MNIVAADTLVLNALLAKPYRLTLIASGAGAGIQSVLWNRAGTSNFLTGAHFPYDRRATMDLLGFEPGKSVSRKTAIQMAVEAYIRSCRGTGTGEPMGLGLTAAVSTNRERKGSNDVVAALITKGGAFFYHLSITKELRLGQTPEMKRVEDGLTADDMAFALLGHALGATHPVGVESIPETELMDILFENPLFLANGKRPANWQEMMDSHFGCIIPTSGNPPHPGHYGMMAEMQQRYNTDGVFAVTADSVHKPSLKVQDLLQRVAYFRSETVPVVLTRKDPLFIDKARQFPAKIFGIGTDTLERLLDPKWSTQSIPDMLAEFWDLEVGFMVFNRNGQDARVLLDHHLHPLARGAGFRQLFDVSFRTWDISSSQLRAQPITAA